MSRPSFRNLLKFSAPLLLAAFALTGCGSGSSGSADTGGGPGGGVPLDPLVTVSDSFNFRAPLDYFVVGTPPIHARFLGGVANNNGAWIVQEGDTATINFATPADAVTFTAKDNYTAAAAAAGAAAQKTTAGSQATAPPFDAAIFVRGTELGWEATADKQLSEVANDVKEVTLALTTASTGGAGEFKVADAGWANVNCGANSTSATITLGAAYEMSCGTNPPNVKLEITTDGNYKFRFDVTGADKTKPMLTVSRVTAGGGGGGGTTTRECGLTDQGLDNTAPYGATMFVRGNVANDWAAAPANQLFQFGGNLLKRELQVEAGAREFKIADAGWVNNCGAGDSPDLTVGAAFSMTCGTNPPNIKANFAETACYEFAFNASNKDAPTVTVKKANLVVDGGGEPADSVEIRIYALDVLTPGATETLYKTVKGSGTLNVDELRRGGETRITRIEIENKGTAGAVGIEAFTWTSNPKFSPAARPVDVYYRRPAGGYTGTTLTIGGKQYPCVATTDSGFGCVAKGVPLYPYQNVSMTVANAGGGSETIQFNADTATQPVYSFANSPVARIGTPGETGKPAAVPRNANEVILFYKRRTDDYAGWGVHLFPTDPATPAWTTWAAPLAPEGVDPQYGAYFRITLPQNANPAYSASPAALETFPAALGLIIHKGDTKDPGPDQSIRIAQDGNVLFVVSGVNDIGTSPQVYPIVKPANAAAHWVTDNTVLWKAPAGLSVASVEMLYSPDASITNGVTGLKGNFQVIPLTSGTNPQLPNIKHLSAYPAFTLPATAVSNAKNIARGQIYVVSKNVDGIVQSVTRTQINGALDDLYAEAAFDAELGPVYSGSTPSLNIWAPTALTDPGVSVKVYNEAGTLLDTKPMVLNATTGVWSVTGTSGWDRQFYTINLMVYSAAADTIVTNEVTDPYSISLATDSVRSQFVNLNDADLKPAGWDALEAPGVAAPEDVVLYELHIRDFSIADATVPAADRGKYTAFDVPGTAGRQHLEQLAQAGLTHVHLLPAFDIATVREDRAARVELDDTVAKLCAANPDAAGLCPANNAKTIRQLLDEQTAVSRTSEEQQRIVNWLRGVDGFNWGYDPYHYGAPEGSYATDPNGAQRVFEFRRLVSGLADAGLGAIMDVVYNHTNASGQAQKSVLDKVVPGYYHRRDPVSGGVLRDSCCDDTAPEFRMMEKLTTDTAVRWVRDYKIGGFRFDIMAFHPLDTITRLQTAVKAVNPQAYVYGEGWNFGAIQDDKRFVTARQANLDGTGIGSFSDRIRDGVRGGGPFDSGISHVRNQGLASGLYYDPNAENSGAAGEKATLLQKADQIRVFLAGGLQTYSFENAAGTVVAGSAIDYGGQPSGYTDDPSEAINYIEAHDNETLWDSSQFKHPASTSTAARVRAHNVANSIVLLAQGVPFLHAGQDILRSKSIDRNSYDSGDWYNEIDWTLATSKWAVGMPLSGDNQQSYPQILAALQNPLAEPSASDRQFAFDVTKEWLEVRKSTTLFRLRTADQIKSRLKMLNTGPDQIPGVVAYRVEGCTSPDLAQPYGAAVTIFNPTKNAITLPLYKDEGFALHPVLVSSVDATVRTAAHNATDGFTVPARTTAVFVKAAQSGCAPYGAPIFVRGSFTDWAAKPEYELQFQGGAAYAVTGAVTAGAQQFKVADSNWTGATNCGGAVDGVTVQLAKPVQLSCFADSKNVSFTPPAAGNYTFSLDASDTASPVLTVGTAPLFGSTTVFVRGGFNDWGNGPAPTAPLAWDGISKYRAEILNLTAGSYEFKIADNNWTGPTNCGGATAGQTVTLGQPFALTCADGTQNMGITVTAGSFLFALDGLNPAAPQLTVEKLPFAAALYVRGLGGDWSDAAANRMSYLGSGLYSYAKKLTAGGQEFKVADSGWTSGTDCGSSSPLTVGAALTLACASPGNGNIVFAVPASGRYEFTLNATSTTSPQLSVTGP